MSGIRSLLLFRKPWRNVIVFSSTVTLGLTLVSPKRGSVCGDRCMRHETDALRFQFAPFVVAPGIAYAAYFTKFRPISYAIASWTVFAATSIALGATLYTPQRLARSSATSPFTGNSEETSKKERHRIEELLTSKGMLSGSYPQFTVAVADQKISVKFKSYFSSGAILTQVEHLAKDLNGGLHPQPILHYWQALVQFFNLCPNSKSEDNDFCIQWFRPLMTPYKTEIEFSKSESFTSAELDALVSILQFAGKPWLSRVSDGKCNEKNALVSILQFAGKHWLSRVSDGKCNEKKLSKLEETAKKERQRLEELLKSEGMPYGSYPPFIVAVNDKKISIKFKAYLKSATKRPLLQELAKCKGGFLIVSEAEFRPFSCQLTETFRDIRTLSRGNEDGDDLCVHVRRSLMNGLKTEIEFSKTGGFSSDELIDLVNILKFAGNPVQSRVGFSKRERV